jgi:hypothetical protein
MQVRDLIEELKRFDERAEVKVEVQHNQLSGTVMFVEKAERIRRVGNEPIIEIIKDYNL